MKKYKRLFSVLLIVILAVTLIYYFRGYAFLIYWAIILWKIIISPDWRYTLIGIVALITLIIFIIIGKKIHLIKSTRASIARYEYYKAKGLSETEIKGLIKSDQAISLNEIAKRMQ